MLRNDRLYLDRFRMKTVVALTCDIQEKYADEAFEKDQICETKQALGITR